MLDVLEDVLERCRTKPVEAVELLAQGARGPLEQLLVHKHAARGPHVCSLRLEHVLTCTRDGERVACAATSRARAIRRSPRWK